MRWVVVVLVGLLPACSVTKGKFSAQNNPGVALPSSFQAHADEGPELVNSLARVFPSSELNRLVRIALKQNPDLRQSAARLEEAGYNTRARQALLKPSLSANFNGTRSQSNTAGVGFNGGTFITDRFSATLDAQWELDVWGRLRAGVSGARATQAALLFDDQAARQSIAAQVAQAYFEVVAATQRRELARRNLRTFESTAAQVERRFEAGLAQLGDLNLAQTDVERTKTTLEARKDERDQAARRLAAVMGRYPDASMGAADFPSLARRVPAGVPSSVLLRRPDLLAAFYRVRAADADITIAQANLLPSFSLTASAGRRSEELKRLLDPNQTIWSLGTNLVAPLVAGGRLRAELGAANARGRLALAGYQAVVLTALREVENALGSASALARQEDAAGKALDAARQAEESASRSFENGLTDILSLLQAQQRAFAAEESLIGIRAARFQNRVALALALGKAY